jgi:hypothetical protein
MMTTNDQPILPASDSLAASLLLRLALLGSAQMLDLTDEREWWQKALNDLRDLGWTLDIAPDGRVSIADVDAPEDSPFGTLERFIHHTVLRDHGWLRCVLREEVFQRIAGLVKITNRYTSAPLPTACAAVVSEVTA